MHNTDEASFVAFDVWLCCRQLSELTQFAADDAQQQVACLSEDADVRRLMKVMMEVIMITTGRRCW